MRKIKQVDRPFIIFRYGLVGRTLYDSDTTLDNAKSTAARHHARRGDRFEVYCRGELVHSIEARRRNGG